MSTTTFEQPAKALAYCRQVMPDMAWSVGSTGAVVSDNGFFMQLRGLRWAVHFEAWLEEGSYATHELAATALREYLVEDGWAPGGSP